MFPMCESVLSDEIHPFVRAKVTKSVGVLRKALNDHSASVRLDGCVENDDLTYSLRRFLKRI